MDVLSGGPPTDDGAQPGAKPGLLPPIVPDHQLLRSIGRGSYGSVWLARNTMGVYRAIKIVYRSSFSDRRPFEREWSGICKFEPISRSHDGFVDVLHVGLNDELGYFYYVMELGDDATSGQNIDPDTYTPKTLSREIAQKGRRPFHDCLQLGLALSQSLAELHRHGLVHRDIKPSNIIFVHGVAKLADIGLVAEVNAAHTYVGTEGFIPPEGPGTPQADVYGLGKVLYEAATGKDRTDFPELPTLLDQLPEWEKFLELNEVILHACHNDFRQRYLSGWEMHADLLVLANGKSVKRLHQLEQRLLRLKRAGGILLLVAMVLAAVSFQVYREWKRALESRQRQVGANVAVGLQAVNSGDLLGALPPLAEALRLDQGNPTRELAHRLRLSATLAQCPKLVALWQRGSMAYDGEFSRDGKKVVIARYHDVVEVRDLETGALCGAPFKPINGVLTACFSPDGRCLLTASEQGSFCVWDAASLTELHRFSVVGDLACAKFSPDGSRIITAAHSGLAQVWDAHSGRLELTLKLHASDLRFADFSHDGRRIVTASNDGTAQLWDAETGQPFGPPLQHDSWVTYAAFSPDDQELVTAGLDRKARVWEVSSGRRIPPDLNHDDGVHSAEFSPDGRLILTACWDGTARLWDAATLQPVSQNTTLPEGERLMRAAFSPDGGRILTAGANGTVCVWDLAGSAVPKSGACIAISPDGSRFLTRTNNIATVCEGLAHAVVSTMALPASPARSLIFNRNGQFVLGVFESQTNSAEQGCALQVWSVQTGQPAGPSILCESNLTDAVLSDDGNFVASYAEDTAQVWDVCTGKALSPPLLHAGDVSGALFSPDGKRLGTKSGRLVQLWDAVSGRPVTPPMKHAQAVEHVEFSSDGRLVVTCCSDDLITRCYAQVWDSTTGLPVGSPLRHGDGVLWAGFSPDGRRVVTGSEDFTAVEWDALTGKPLFPPLKHPDQVLTASFSHDGKRIITICRDHAVRVWDAETGNPLTPPLPHLILVAHAGGNGDARHLVTWSRDGNYRIWDLGMDQRPVADLTALAGLLCGGSGGLHGEADFQSSGALERTWQRLRAQYPADFVVQPEEAVVWHEFQVEKSALEQQWFAAAFHLEQLSFLRPSDSALATRLARAREHLRQPR